jgi:hypothetical protein
MRRERFPEASEVPRGRGPPESSIRRRKVDRMRTTTTANVGETVGVAAVGRRLARGRSLRR